MSAALGVRRQVRMGPALRVAPLPVGGLVLSVALHALCLAVIVFGLDLLRENESETYIVNLVPAVAAIGSPGRPTPTPTTPAPRPPAPPRQAPPQDPPREVSAPPELPVRAAPPPALPPRERPPRAEPPRDLPSRDLPSRDLPLRPRSAALSEPALPARTPATPTPPRREEKELPTMTTARAPATTAPAAPRASTPPPTPTPAATPTPSTSAPLPVPAPPPGLPTGSPVGTDPVTLDVDFPYAWYIQALVRKISEQWNGKASPGLQPVITFQIARNGTVNVSRMKVRETSTNPAYDQTAMRAIADAVPFPPLPEEFKDDVLTVHLRFRFQRDRG